MAIGLPAAFFTARRTFPGRRVLLAFSGIPLCVPPVIIALAFVLFYGRQGYINTFLMRVTGAGEPPLNFLYSLAGVVIAHGFYNFPVVLRTVSQVWERLPEAEEDAARLLGAGRFRIFRTITLPRLAPAILSAAVLVFLYCFFSFIIVLLFGGVGGTTLEVELYQAARSSLNFRFAGIIALTETAAAVCVVVFYTHLQKKLRDGNSGLQVLRTRPRFRKAGEKTVFALYAVFLLFFFVGPLASILFRSFTVYTNDAYSGSVRFGLQAWKTFFSRPGFFPALANTCIAGLSAALISTAAALFLSFYECLHVSSRKGLKTAFRIIPLMPLAVSSVMLGFGWTLLVPRGNMFVLILAQAALAWPFAWTQIQASLGRVPPGILDSARLLSAGLPDIAFRTLLPLVKKGIFSGAAFVFAISAGDASLPLVLSIGGFENLGLMLYRLMGSYRFSEACVCAVVLTLLTGFVFLLQDRERVPVRSDWGNKE
ncbi:iron ABC transporter permease [Brucepastera parasyntrophica]|uniref:ABC transporter permease n=1 Tax=Brucepastera parasyntrophica TaxID=2880008 RepID=UPI00210AD7AE|nr:iron ABC transporter permease [Brucepastera parasyntrophica]ULQ61085.1 iron ABC transporter permease [Brucepastera parasyntrophica]